MTDKDIIVIETENLFLKKYQKTDFRHFLDIHLSPTIMKYFSGGVMGIDEAKERFEKIQKHQEKFGFSYYAVFRKVDNEFIGQAGLYYNYDMTLNLCYALLEQFQNLGYGTEMVSAVLKHGFENFNLSIVSVLIAVDNYPSIHLVEKLGGIRHNVRTLYDGIVAASYTISKEDFFKALPNIKHYNYRIGVGAILINKDGLIYLFENIGYSGIFQGPEGGQDNDTAIDAIYKEIKEEIGLNKDQIEYIAETKYYIRYNFFNNEISEYYDHIQYIGQKKKFFLFKIKDENPNFNFKSTDAAQEFSSFKLFKKKDAINCISPLKKDVYKIVFDEFKKYLK